MSPELEFKLLQRAKAAAERRLRLLGRGLDAIVQCTRIPPRGWFERVFYSGGFQRADLPCEPSANARLLRYQTAVMEFGSPSFELREVMGAQLQRALRARWAPDAPAGTVILLDRHRARRAGARA